MKKILSLLSMLMITVMAFATDYKDALHFEVNLMGAKTVDLPSGTLSIDKRVDGTYTVTAQGCDFSAYEMGNWYEIICDEVAGTTDANGVTTINVDSPYAFRSSDNATFSSTKLVVKFNDTKAYASFEGKIYIYANRDFKYTFGTDEGFDGGGSTGGGETGGEDKPAIVDIVEADYAPNGTAFGFPFTINWQTQKLVAKLDLSTCSRYTHNEGIITVGTNNGSGDISLWNPNAGEANCHLYYTHYYYGTDEKQLNLHYLEKPSDKVVRVDNSLQNLEPGLVVFTFDKEGLHVGDNLIATPDQMSTLYNSTSLIFGSKEGSTRSNATYKYVKVVPLDWTETTEPTEPEVTVVATKKFNAIDYSNTWSQAGTANVTFEEMSDETVKMKFATDGINISANALTKGTDAKNRTTYTGEAVNDAMSTLTYTIKAVVYTEGTEEKLYMTMEANSGVTFTVGTDPDYVAPEPPAGESTIVENWKSTEGTSWSHDVTIDWNTQKLVVSVNLADTGSDKGFLGVTKKGNTPGWNNDGIIFYNVDGTTVQGYAPGQDNNANTNYVTKGEDPVRFEISKENGVKCQGNVVISAELIAHLTNQSNIVVGAADKVAGALYNYIKVVSLDWKEPTEPEVTVKEEKTFNEALYMVQGTTSTKVADAKVVVKEMSDNTINMSLQFNGNEYTSTELTKGTDDKNRTTYTGKVSKDTQTFDVVGVVYEKETADRLYMTMTAAGVTFVVGENPDVVTPEVTEVSNKTYTSNLRILDGETTVVEEAEADVNIIKYSDESYKVTLKNVNMLNKTQDLVFVGKALIEEAPTEATEPLTIIAKSDAATTEFFGEEMSATFEITEVSADEIKMGFVLNNTSLEYQGEFNYTEEETPEVYTNNLHIYDAAAPETDLFQADQAKVEFLATETGEFKLTLKDVTLNEKTQDLVFTGALPTPQPGGQDPLAEEGETTPAEPAMVLNAIADDATTRFFDVATYPTAVFNVSYDKNDNFMMTFTIVAGAKNYGGEFNYEKKNPDTPDPELFSKENYVADGTGFEWDIKVDWDTQKIVMSIDPSTCTGSCEHVIGLGASPTTFHGNLHLYRTNDQQLQGYFETSASNNNTGKFAETAPFLVEVSKAQGFVVNNEVKIASSAMSDLFTLSTVKMGTGEGANDKSRATYNYVKVVDKDWTAPKDPDTGINATTVAEGEVEFFTVNGVKLNKLQKGLNIVRTADGKVKKVLVK